jgi:hypothetical protein
MDLEEQDVKLWNGFNWVSSIGGILLHSRPNDYRFHESRKFIYHLS